MNPDVAWVVIARWTYPNGKTEWALEYWDERNEADEDAFFEDESGARALAAREFGIGENDWRDGPQPITRG